MNKTAKILFLTHVGNLGGAEIKTISCARYFKNRCEFCTFDDGDIRPMLKQNDIAHEILEMPSGFKNFKRENNPLTALKTLPQALGFIWRLGKKCKNYDIVIPVSQKSFVFCALSKIIARKPIIWFMNDLLSPEHFNPKLIKFLLLLSRFSANHIIVNSEASLKAWLESGGTHNNVSVMYSGIDVNSFTAQIPDENALKTLKKNYAGENGKLIGLFGRISTWKGQDVFLKALARLPENVHGIIVGGAQFGEENYESELRKLAEELGVAQRVTFTGHTNNVSALMAACDVVTHCSTSPEPFGRVIVEAMLAKTPIIASRAGGPEELISHEQDGYLYPIGNDKDLAEMIETCLSKHLGPDDILVQSAYDKAVEKFSDIQTDKTLLQIIENLSGTI